MLPALSGLEGKGRGCVCFGAGPHCAAGQHQAQAPAAGGAKLSRGAEFRVRCGVQVLCRGGAAAMDTQGMGYVIPGRNSTESTCKIPVQKPPTR